MRLFRHVFVVLALVFGILGLLALLSLRSIPVYSGPGRVATMNGDANCDGTLDISDPVHILNYLFLGGTEPCAIAQQEPACCSEVTAAIDRLTAALQQSRNGCNDPVFRMQANGDGTVTDSCTGLMWRADIVTFDLTLDGIPEREFTYVQANVIIPQRQGVGGHADWRIPTVFELESLVRWLAEKPYEQTLTPMFSTPFDNVSFWSSTPQRILEEVSDPEIPLYIIGFDGDGTVRIRPDSKSTLHKLLLVRTATDS